LATRLAISIPTLRAMEHGVATVAIGTWIRALSAMGRAEELEVLFRPARRPAEQAFSVAGMDLSARLQGPLATLLGPTPTPGDLASLVESLIVQAAENRQRTVLARQDQELKTAAAKQAIMQRILDDPAIVDQARQHLAEIPDPWLRSQWQTFLDLPTERMQAEMRDFRFMGSAPWHSMVQSSPFAKVAA
jgi:hypothetical protein